MCIRCVSSLGSDGNKVSPHLRVSQLSVLWPSESRATRTLEQRRWAVVLPGLPDSGTALTADGQTRHGGFSVTVKAVNLGIGPHLSLLSGCLLYTSDAADDWLVV